MGLSGKDDVMSSTASAAPDIEQKPGKPVGIGCKFGSRRIA